MYRVKFSDGTEFVGDSKEELASKKSLPGMLFEDDIHRYGYFLGYVNCPWERIWRVGVKYTPTGEIFNIGTDEDYIHADNPTQLIKVVWERKERELNSEVERLQNLLDSSEKEESVQRDRADQALSILREIGDLNEKGGPGSRKAVRELLNSQGILPCENCNHYVCDCD